MKWFGIFLSDYFKIQIHNKIIYSENIQNLNMLSVQPIWIYIMHHSLWHKYTINFGDVFFSFYNLNRIYSLVFFIYFEQIHKGFYIIQSSMRLKRTIWCMDCSIQNLKCNEHTYPKFSENLLALHAFKTIGSISVSMHHFHMIHYDI